MSKMIQVRNVPDRLHRELTRRARRRGQSLTEFIEEILEQEVARPPAEEVFARVRAREPMDIGMTAAEAIAEGYAERARR